MCLFACVCKFSYLNGVVWTRTIHIYLVLKVSVVILVLKYSYFACDLFKEVFCGPSNLRWVEQPIMGSAPRDWG